MVTTSISRRAFVQGTASALALSSLPKLSFGATYLRTEWQAFKLTPHYASFLNALRTMKGVSDSTNRNSWQYWINIHLNYCPHDLAYFLAWHRGYIYYFEQQIRTISGDTTFTLPYWDYYSYPTLPSEFTDTATGNPLYTPRVNTNLYSALSLSPFSASVTSFQRSLGSGAFEYRLENAPHDPVHDVMGGYMANITTAPMDPIFYLHHCNIDRLWNAWSLRPTSKVPNASNSYWSGTHIYASGLTMARSLTRTTGGLGYDYANDTTPSALPPQAQHGHILRVQAQVSPINVTPPVGTYPPTGPHTVSPSRNSLGGVTNIVLGDGSTTARIKLLTGGANALHDVLATSPAADLNGSETATSNLQMPGQAKKSFQYVKLVLDGLSALGNGKDGGYFYNVYLNLPLTGDVDSVAESRFVCTLGAFEISVSDHHGMNQKAVDVTYLLSSLGDTNLNQILVSFVRVNALAHPTGNVVSIKHLRLELASDAP